jgi:hypothetical protein
MNLIKTPLRSRLTQRNLEALMRISMEGKDKLSNSNLDTLVDKFKNKKDRYMMLYDIRVFAGSFGNCHGHLT